jgi:hypothetical protein
MMRSMTFAFAIAAVTIIASLTMLRSRSLSIGSATAAMPSLQKLHATAIFVQRSGATSESLHGAVDPAKQSMVAHTYQILWQSRLIQIRLLAQYFPGIAPKLALCLASGS